IPDGSSNTIMIVEGGDPVIWTKPDDIEYDPKKPLPNLGLPGTDVISVVMGDGSVHSINLKTISEKTIRNAMTADDGEPLGADWDGGGGGGGAGAVVPKVIVPKATDPKAPPKGAGPPTGKIK